MRQVYSEWIAFITSKPTLEAVANYRLSDESEARINYLLDANREGNLTREERVELDDYIHLEHLMRLVKIRAIEKLSGNL